METPDAHPPASRPAGYTTRPYLTSDLRQKEREPDVQPVLEDAPVRLADKGLVNEPGANNCFLNVVLQSFFHLTPFVDPFVRKKEHICDSSGHCVFCSLKLLFEQHTSNSTAHVPPAAVREALSSLFSDADRFKLNAMEDAAETFDALLQKLHESEQVSKDSEDNCYPPCFVHATFGLNVAEQAECPECGDASEPFLYWSFVYWVSAAQIMNYDQPARMGRLVKKITELTKKSCSNSTCTSKARVKRYCLTLPKVLVLGVVWQKEIVSKDEVTGFISRVEEHLATSELFCQKKRSHGSTAAADPNAELMGLVCYYGKHYIAYFKSLPTQQWVLFDDSYVKAVGPDWSTVQRCIIDGRLQPFLLFYETNRPPPSRRPPTPSPHVPYAPTSPRTSPVRPPSPLRSSSPVVPPPIPHLQAVPPVAPSQRPTSPRSQFWSTGSSAAPGSSRASPVPMRQSTNSGVAVSQPLRAHENALPSNHAHERFSRFAPSAHTGTGLSWDYYPQDPVPSAVPPSIRPTTKAAANYSDYVFREKYEQRQRDREEREKERERARAMAEQPRQWQPRASADPFGPALASEPQWWNSTSAHSNVLLGQTRPSYMTRREPTRTSMEYSPDNYTSYGNVRRAASPSPSPRYDARPSYQPSYLRPTASSAAQAVPRRSYSQNPRPVL
eukprot:TRINITY_DN17116_c0_g1_i1.p1 TRINITY_DN17116_c0_g1~~TRINITY_DN17116_c0_g1_i1.p1  ORF type:complete len:669 (-),score=66.83 TRINITY_DN17116_c0_g1_i1:7-2013(-)